MIYDWPKMKKMNFIFPCEISLGFITIAPGLYARRSSIMKSVQIIQTAKFRPNNVNFFNQIWVAIFSCRGGS
jgi:hypothetical protein